MARSPDGDDPPKRPPRLAGPTSYEVGYGKPPVATRFKPGHSGNPGGRPRGAKNKTPPLQEERLKTLIMEEAYRSVPIIDQGRRVGIPMITAVLRAVAVNAAKGNNRAAALFTTLVSKTEAANHKLATEAFGSAIDYKQTWTKELKRRKRLGLTLPDPVPHPDDIILDARKMTVQFKGPMTREEIPRYQLGAELLAAYEEVTAEHTEKLATLPDGPDKEKLRREIRYNSDLCAKLRPHYGPRSERSKDPIIREVEDLLGVPFDPGDFDKEEGEG